MTYVTMTGLRSVGVDKVVIDDDAYSESLSNPTICWDRSLHSVLISSKDHSPCHASVHRKIDSINSRAAVLKTMRRISTRVEGLLLRLVRERAAEYSKSNGIVLDILTE